MIENVAASAKKQKECVRVVTGEAMVLGMGTSLVQATKAQKFDLPAGIVGVGEARRK